MDYRLLLSSWVCCFLPLVNIFNLIFCLISLSKPGFLPVWFPLTFCAWFPIIAYIEFNILYSIAENLDDSVTLEYPCGSQDEYIQFLIFICVILISFIWVLPFILNLMFWIQ